MTTRINNFNLRLYVILLHLYILYHYLLNIMYPTSVDYLHHLTDYVQAAEIGILIGDPGMCLGIA